MNSRKATAMPACTASTLARSVAGRLPPNRATAAPNSGEDQHPQQHGALVVPPHAGDLVEQRLGRVRVGPHVLDREVGRDVGVGEGEEGDGEQGELGERGRLGDLPSGAHRGVRAPGRQRHLHQRHGRAPGRGRNVRARRSWGCAPLRRCVPSPACGEGLGVGREPRRPVVPADRRPHPASLSPRGRRRRMGSRHRARDATSAMRHFWHRAPWPCRRPARRPAP